MLRIFFLLSISLILLIQSSFGEKIQNIVVFGDSLSDSGYTNNFHNIDKDWPTILGNSKKVKQATYSSPNEGYTVWPQYLGINNKSIATPNNIFTPKKNISRSVKPSLSGNDYAAGGATTICNGIGEKDDYTPPPIGPLRAGESCDNSQQNTIEKYNQIDSYLKQHNNKANPNTIYIIWAGANNTFLQLESFTNNQSILAKVYFLVKYLVTDNVSPTNEIRGMVNAAKDIAYDTSYLIKHGAKPRNIYVINLPDLGITPIATANGKNLHSFKTSLFNSLSRAFNDELKRDISPKGINIIDSQKFFNTIVKDKKIKIGSTEYKFSNVTQSACNFNGSNALICIPKNYINGKYNKYLFAGQVHPTSYAHKAFAKYVENKIFQ
ncbi:hypothetical protein fh0823_20050 [Francisella halioticida]|uniref:SGNH/GDSL hydrolase family protein n=1 Tax=Francisella halioticida TaxID=549298 RepID=UPI0012FC31D2|nr:SGNH/GDSL hydrolase family protein [Francisella halioticida]BCD91866.1 hypothetical protein fh0823_20050 [Francisella halioticida]